MIIIINPNLGLSYAGAQNLVPELTRTATSWQGRKSLVQSAYGNENISYSQRNSRLKAEKGKKFTIMIHIKVISLSALDSDHAIYIQVSLY